MAPILFCDPIGLLSPAAQFWVMTHNLDASQIQGTGKGGRIMNYYERALELKDEIIENI